MTNADSLNDKENMGSHTLFTPTKNLCFKEVESILRSPKYSRTNENESSKAYFKPSSNVKPTKKKRIFRNMVLKTYLQLSLPIFIQQVNEYGATKKITRSYYCNLESFHID